MGNCEELISRQAAIDFLTLNAGWKDEEGRSVEDWDERKKIWADLISLIPSTQPEQLTDKEQRIFLAAMAREEKICEEVDRNYVREPYEDSLVRVCKEIRRKVKDALWT